MLRQPPQRNGPKKLAKGDSTYVFRISGVTHIATYFYLKEYGAAVRGEKGEKIAAAPLEGVAATLFGPVGRTEFYSKYND